MKEALISKPSKHIVWLDVVRLVAMFTVVCCHSADPFNFYAGDPTADIASIIWILAPSVCAVVCYDYWRIVASRERGEWSLL